MPPRFHRKTKADATKIPALTVRCCLRMHFVRHFYTTTKGLISTRREIWFVCVPTDASSM